MEVHPFLNMLMTERPTKGPEIVEFYFYSSGPQAYRYEKSYSGGITEKAYTAHEWAHPISEVVNSLIGAGSKIEYLNEYPFVFFRAMPYMQQDEQGFWRIPGDKIPLLFTLKATKPE